MGSINDLPNELLGCVFLLLPMKTLKSPQSPAFVCSRFARLIVPMTWRTITLSELPKIHQVAVRKTPPPVLSHPYHDYVRAVRITGSTQPWTWASRVYEIFKDVRRIAIDYNVFKRNPPPMRSSTTVLIDFRLGATSELFFRQTARPADWCSYYPFMRWYEEREYHQQLREFASDMASLQVPVRSFQIPYCGRFPFGNLGPDIEVFRIDTIGFGPDEELKNFLETAPTLKHVFLGAQQDMAVCIQALAKGPSARHLTTLGIAVSSTDRLRMYPPRGIFPSLECLVIVSGSRAGCDNLVRAYDDNSRKALRIYLHPGTDKDHLVTSRDLRVVCYRELPSDRADLPASKGWVRLVR